jgi:hypothetical protein
MRRGYEAYDPEIRKEGHEIHPNFLFYSIRPSVAEA